MVLLQAFDSLKFFAAQHDQWIILGLFCFALIGFALPRIRYDVVAMAALILAVLFGLVPANQAFMGFGHPAVITVALVLVLSDTVQRSHVLEYIAQPLSRIAGQPLLFMGVLCLIGMLLSAFMNNVGALVLLMPLAVRLSPRPAQVLMPLSFATILGGTLTLIGTPPNIIVSSFRKVETGADFAFFDFIYASFPIALIGLAFIVFIGWRLIPLRKESRKDNDSYITHAFVTEVIVPKDNPLIERTISEIEDLSELNISVLSIVREKQRFLVNILNMPIKEGDILVLRANTEELEGYLAETGFEILGSQEFVNTHMQDKDVKLYEAIVTPHSSALGMTPKELRLRRSYTVNVLGIARKGSHISRMLAHTPIQAGDVVLLQGSVDSTQTMFDRLQWLPLRTREISLVPKNVSFIPLINFALAVLLTSLGLVPIHISFAVALGLNILFKKLPIDHSYQAIEWPIIVLLAAMIPLGDALQSSGASAMIVSSIMSQSSAMPIWLLLMLVMFVTMNLTDVMNNAATAVVMAPLSIGIAQSLGVNIDTFLMAVAIASSCAFKTPIGHQNNLLVMGTGGYRFGDYWRMGLPLQIIIMITATPILLLVWPL